MISKSVLDMINDTTEKAYILTALEYIKNLCASRSDDKADENGCFDVCKGCPFSNIDDWCFFQAPYYDGKIPEKWNLEKLKEKLEKGGIKI